MVLGSAPRHESRHVPFATHADGLGVFLGLTLESLIREVHQYDTLFFGECVDQISPLIRGVIQTSRIVTADLQQNTERLGLFFHRRNDSVHGCGAAVNVRCFHDLESCPLAHRRMIAPRRNRKNDAIVLFAEEHLHEPQVDRKRSCTAGGSDGRYDFLRIVADELRHGFAKSRQTRQERIRIIESPKILFQVFQHFLDTRKEERLATFVHKNPECSIDGPRSRSLRLGTDCKEWIGFGNR